MLVKSIINSGFLLYKYGTLDLKKEMIENIGRFKIYSANKEFFNKNKIRNLNYLSKKEINIFANTLNGNPFKNAIIQKYNNEIKNGKSLKNKDDLFKSLATFSELLQAEPYNEKVFAEQILTFVIQSHFEENLEKVRLLKKSLNLLVEKDILKKFTSQDQVAVFEAKEILQQNELVSKVKDERNIMRKVIVSSIVLYAVCNMHEAIDTYINKINYIQLQLDPLTTFLAATAILGGIYSSLFKVSEQTMNKIIDHEKNKLILGSNPKNMGKNLINKKISNEMLDPIIYNSETPNNKYLALSSFLIEKLYNPQLQLNKSFISENNLNNTQVLNLNKMTENDIHNVAFLQFREIRELFIFENISYENKVLLKKMDLLYSLDKDRIYKNVYTSFDNIKGLSNSLKNKLKKLPEIEQKMMLIHLFLNQDEKGNPATKVVSFLEREISNSNFKLNLNKSLDENFENKYSFINENSSFYHLKKIYSWIVDKDTKLILANQQTKEAIDSIIKNNDFSNLKLINDQYGTIIEKTKTKVLEKIKNIRETEVAKVENKIK